MPAYASTDAEHVAHGIRLGGRGRPLDDALAAAREPLDVPGLEGIARPDLKPADEGPGFEYETIGMLHLYEVAGTYKIATRWFGWLPGHYDSRAAALVAYGYVLGGEQPGLLSRLTSPRADGYTLAEIEAFATRP